MQCRPAISIRLGVVMVTEEAAEWHAKRSWGHML
jgi:hypothetical protein